jgi:hypothetical protein
MFKAKTFKRFVQELGWPLLVAILWTAANYFAGPRTTWVKDLLNLFGPTFFFFAWIYGSFVRIEKTARSEEYYEKITSKVTGGDTYPIVGVVQQQPQGSELMFPISLLVSTQGSYSLYDLTVVITDIERMQYLHKNYSGANMPNYQEKYQLGTLGRAYEQKLTQLDSGDKQSFSFHIQSFARNGKFEQRLLIRKVGDSWLHASCVLHEGNEVHKYVAPKFPESALKMLPPNTALL